MIVRDKIINGNKVGVNSKVFIELLNNIEDSDLLAMDSIDLLTIINQGIIPNDDRVKSILTTEPFSDTRKGILEKIKNDIEEGTYVSTNTLNENEIPEDNLDDGTDTTSEATINAVDSNHNTDDEDKELTRIRFVKNLKTIDNSLVNAIDDTEALKVLMANKFHKMWNGVCNNILTLEDIMNECNNAGKFYNQLAQQFKKEYDIVSTYEPPKGFNAHKIRKNGEIVNISPNMMQKLCVNRLKQNQYYGNWSGMGSGKTLSAIISSREIGSHLTIVVSLNSNVKQWGEDILNAYPETTGTRVYYADTNEYNISNLDMAKFNYLVIPYSRLSLHNAELKLKSVADNKVDFIVIDEVHKAKSRNENKDDSKRRERLMKLIAWSKQANPSMYEMVMSGTPIINELSEAKSVLTLLTGNCYEDVKTTRTLQNALRLHQLLLIHGCRFIPSYDQTLSILTSENTPCLSINGDKYLDKLKGCNSISTEKMFVNDKLNAIKSFLGKGVIIYTHYTTGFIAPIRKYIEANGYTTALYSDNRDNRDNELLRFRNGEADIMIASSPINTGVDRLQEVCDTMIIITLPWTNAEFEQLKGRIYRQGMRDDANIRVIIPQVIVNDDDGNTWSWDKQRYNLIRLKKTIADCVIDGVIPTTNFPKRETLYKQSVESLKIWKDRINNNEFFVRSDDGIQINLDVKVDEYKQRVNSIVSNFNSRGRSTEHSKLHKQLTDNPKDWFDYDRARRESMKDWPEIPYEHIASKIKNRNRVVADFGCGENQLRNCIPNNKVYAFDHVAAD